MTIVGLAGMILVASKEDLRKSHVMSCQNYEVASGADLCGATHSSVANPQLRRRHDHDQRGRSQAQIELSLLGVRYAQKKNVYPPMTKVVAGIVESEAGGHIHHISQS